MGFALPKNYRPGHTYSDYCDWEGDWELIDGIPHSMSPQPSGKHQNICLELIAQLRDALRKCKHCKVSLPMDWKIADHTVVQPDLFVACFPFLDKKFIDQSPTLVVEVLSPSTRTKDLTVKRAIYLDQKVKYYVIIDPDTEEYSVLELEGNSYSEPAKGHEGNFTFLLNECKAEVNFAAIWS